MALGAQVDLGALATLKALGAFFQVSSEVSAGGPGCVVGPLSHEDFGGSGGPRGAGLSGGSWGPEASACIGALKNVKALGTLEWTWGPWVVSGAWGHGNFEGAGDPEGFGGQVGSGGPWCSVGPKGQEIFVGSRGIGGSKALKATRNSKPQSP